MSPRRVLAIVGPTATGKTGLSIEVARQISGEIISMDSRQVYRGMDIGTAKATHRQRRATPHHGLDLVHPDQRFSAGQFARYARACIVEIQTRGKVPILVGGTGFFLRALTHPIFAEPPLDPDRRRDLASYLASLRDEELHRWVGEVDPETAGKLRAAGGRQRLLRALELPLLTGRPLSWWHRNAPPEAQPVTPTTFALDLPRPRLDAAIGDRMADMLRWGLVDEVAGLLASGYDERSPGLNATGYAELIPHLRGEVGLEEAVNRIRANTRAYSRRQVTWFRTQQPEGTLRLDATEPPEKLVARIVEEVGGKR